MKVELAG